MYLVMYFLTLSIYFIGAKLIDQALMVDKLSLFGDMVVFSSYAMQVIMSFLHLLLDMLQHNKLIVLPYT